MAIPNGNRIEYIMSGCGYARLMFKEAWEDQDCYSFITSAMDKMQTETNHKFGILYNAFTEKRFGQVFREQYANHVESIHADSGGLQVVTRGLRITEKLKSEVFYNQAKFSDMAMCFDEIPVSFSGAKSSRLDLSNRWFDRDRFEECAKQTGRNIHEQIETFIKEESNSRPICIIQGNDYDTYMRWTELVLSQIPQENHKLIGGIAMGAAALGHGTLEDIQRAFYYTQLPIDIPHKHMHLLAVGSVARLLPNIIFMQSGVYNNMHLTYDSTTHSSGIHMGSFYAAGGRMDVGRNFDPVVWGKVYDSVTRYFDMGLSLKEFHQAMNNASKEYEAVVGSRVPLIKAYVATIFASILNFMYHVELCMRDEKALFALADKNDNINAFYSLRNVRTLDDFRHWENQVGKSVTSHSVASDKAATLEEFF